MGIEFNDLQAQISFLTTEKMVLVNDLTNLHKDIAEHTEKLKEMRFSQEIIQDEIKDAHLKLSLERTEIIKSKEKLDQDKINHIDIVNNLKNETLNLINEITSKTGILEQKNKEVESLQVMISKLNNDLLKKDDLEQELNDLKMSIQLLKEEKDTFVNRNIDLKNENETIEIRIKEKTEKMNELLDSIIKKADQAEYKYKEFTDKLHKKSRDLNIILNRIEKEYSTVFPELRFPINALTTDN